MSEGVPETGGGVTRREAVSLGAVLVLGAMCWFPTLFVGLLSDDWGMMFLGDNPWHAFHGHWVGGGKGGFYRPLSRLLLVFEGRAFGSGGVPAHAVSIALHLGTGVFVFGALKRIGRPTAGLLAAAFGVLHPAATESVAWISSQTDLLALFFFAMTAWACAGALSTRRAFLSLIPAAFACLSKDTAVLLGPSVALAAGIAFFFGPRSGAARRRAATLAGCHLVLWALYMILRKVFLGRFLTETANDVSLVQMGAAVLATMQELLSPFAPHLFGDRSGIESARYPLLWALFFLPVCAVLCLIRGRATIAAVLLLFGLSLGPVTGTFVSSLNMEGMERYLLHPLWLFAALAGLLLEPLLAFALRKRQHGFLLVAGGLVVLRLGYMTHSEIRYFERAAAVRDGIEEEIAAVLPGAANPVVIVANYPDRVGGAYVFRNGFAEFLRTRFDRAVPLIPAGELDIDGIPADATIFRLAYRGEGERPWFRLDSELTSDLAALRSAAATPPPPPYRIALSMGVQVPTSQDLARIGEEADGGLRFEVTGRDPNIGMPFPANMPLSRFDRAKIEFAFLQPENGPAEDVFEFIFFPGGTASSPITLSREVRVSAGNQSIEFDLSGNLVWKSADSMRWMRFDTGERYRGRIAIRSMALE